MWWIIFLTAKYPRPLMLNCLILSVFSFEYSTRTSPGSPWVNKNVTQKHSWYFSPLLPHSENWHRCRSSYHVHPADNHHHLRDFSLYVQFTYRSLITEVYLASYKALRLSAVDCRYSLFCARLGVSLPDFEKSSSRGLGLLFSETKFSGIVFSGDGLPVGHDPIISRFAHH
jgi:hypothetical protein